MGNFYAPRERSVKQVVNEKIKVLEDFRIVTIENEYTIREKLLAEINNHPNTDPDIVADRVARKMITDKLYI